MVYCHTSWKVPFGRVRRKEGQKAEATWEKMVGRNFRIKENEFSFGHIKTEVPVRHLREM